MDIKKINALLAEKLMELYNAGDKGVLVKENNDDDLAVYRRLAKEGYAAHVKKLSYGSEHFVIAREGILRVEKRDAEAEAKKNRRNKIYSGVTGAAIGSVLTVLLGWLFKLFC